MVIELPRLRADQYAIAKHPARTKIVAAGRRYGKSILCGCLALLTANQGGAVAWCVPTYANGDALWSFALKVCQPLSPTYVDINKSERKITFKGTGGFLRIYSMDGSAIRGGEFDLVILDEAALMNPSAWFEDIQPTLLSRQGSAIIISTPKAKNWFHTLYCQGLTDGIKIKSFHAPSSDNPRNSVEDLDFIRKSIPERAWKQEYLAEFLDDGGAVFRNILNCALVPDDVTFDLAGTYVSGVDIAKSEDYTVISIIDSSKKPRQVVDIDRFNGVSWSLIIERIQGMSQKWKCISTVIEDNNATHVIEALSNMGVSVQGFHTSNASKQQIIDKLSMAIEYQEIIYPKNDVLLAELAAFSIDVLPKSGLVRYAAPAGMHDDTVMSLAIANHAAETAVPIVPFDHPLLAWN